MKTEVQFANGKIAAPLAFSGSYNLLGNCMQFKGWAQTSIGLRFDQASQTVFGQVEVEGVNLEGVNPLANNFVTVFVRNAIDQRVNPLELIRAQQLQLMIPVNASNGAVKAQVKDVRAEMLDGSLKMHISYEFAGTKGARRRRLSLVAEEGKTIFSFLIPFDGATRMNVMKQRIIIRNFLASHSIQIH